MKTLHFKIPAVPVAQPRPRATVVNGQARVFEANKGHGIHLFKASVRHAAQEAYSGPPLDCPLKVSLTFLLPRPKGMRWKTKPMPRVPHVGRLDCDNLAKGVLDALNGLLFCDDGQVFDLDVTKWIAAGDEQPHVECLIQME